MAVKKETEELAKKLERAINCFGNEEDMKFLVEEMCYMHRTLQQSFFGKFILPLVKKMAENYNYRNYDARNEAACKLARDMWSGLVCENPHFAVTDDTALPMI